MTVVLQEQSREGRKKRQEGDVQLNFSKVLLDAWPRKVGSGGSPFDMGLVLCDTGQKRSTAGMTSSCVEGDTIFYRVGWLESAGREEGIK